MKPTLPKISIVMPSYNQVEFIERAIRSVLDQDYPDKELIVIDGASTDGSVDVIKKYADRLAFWVSEKDSGQTNALNKGFRKATGDVTAWLNSDDMYPPGVFTRVADEFRRDPNLDIVYGDQYRIDVNDKVIGETRYTKVRYPMTVLLGNVLPQPPAFWKRELFDRVGYLDETMRFIMDLEFMMRVSKVARMKHIRCHTSYFRWQENQKSQTIGEVGVQEYGKVRERHLADACGCFPPPLVKVCCQLERVLCFLLQGDGGYVLRGLLRRVGLSKARVC